LVFAKLPPVDVVVDESADEPALPAADVEPDAAGVLLCVRKNDESGAFVEMVCSLERPATPPAVPLAPLPCSYVPPPPIARTVTVAPVVERPMFWQDAPWIAAVSFSTGVIAGAAALGLYAYFAR